jgi:uncharacterized protein YkwD
MHVDRGHEFPPVRPPRSGWSRRLSYVGAFGALVLLVLACREDPEARNITYWYTNVERGEAGLPGLAQSAYLQQQALHHSMKMCADQRGIFHSDLAAQYGGEAWRGLGKNVGVSSASSSADATNQIWAAWMASPGHRANIVGSWHDMGVGAVRCDEDGKLYYTQVFRRR